jgi:hypothetical protein
LEPVPGTYDNSWMKLIAGSATIAKKGNSAEENEDAYAPHGLEGLQQVPFNCAVADGATETSYSALWAKFVKIDNPDQFDDHIPALQESWKIQTGGKDLPWYAEQKLEKGAFSTLLGLRITEGEFSNLLWHAVAVGDSMLFHVRAYEVVASFPPFTSADFKTSPMLLSTNSMVTSRKQLYRFNSGILEAGDRIYLATDKIAEWIVRSLECNTKPFIQLDQVTRTAGSFTAFIDNLTQFNELKNDDYTIVWLEAQEVN